MTTKFKLKGWGVRAAEAMEPHIRPLYDNPNGSLLIVAELQHTGRTQVGPHGGGDPEVTARIAHLEVPGQRQQDVVRDLLRGLYLLRTARGTLDEATGAVRLDEEAAKAKDAPLMVFAGDAIEARSVLRETREQLAQLEVSVAAGTLDNARAAKKIRKLHDGVDRFLKTGSREARAEQERLDLRASSGVWTADGEVDPGTGELAGQDAGTRVPAPEAGP